MASPLRRINAISLFVEDLDAVKTFYRQVFAVPVVYEDEDSCAIEFENLIVNLLKVEAARQIVAPGRVAPGETGSRFQLSIWVPDVDAVCADLQRRGIALLAGPLDRPWGMRTANFVDPAGHSWEIAQKIAAK
jgi:catechol 2,3-dioxygenase-like lactoylglutathione lyase family enzyme